MAKFAYSGLAIRDCGTTAAHGVGIIEAASKDEAFGKAMRIQHKLYPMDEGWSNHHAIAVSVDAPVVEPETAHIIEANA